MSFIGLLTHSVKVFNLQASTTESRYGDPEDNWDAGTMYRGLVQPGTAEEDLRNRDTRVTIKNLFLPPTAIISATSEVEFLGERYKVVGEPKPYYTPRGLHHFEISIRLVTG